LDAYNSSLSYSNINIFLTLKFGTEFTHFAFGTEWLESTNLSNLFYPRFMFLLNSKEFFFYIDWIVIGNYFPKRKKVKNLMEDCVCDLQTFIPHSHSLPSQVCGKLYAICDIYNHYNSVPRPCRLDCFNKSCLDRDDSTLSICISECFNKSSC
jgi:hypothetical protein